MTEGDYSLIADLYDRYITTTQDLRFWIVEAQTARGEVLELMAGTGRISIPLAEAGVKLTCVDRSAAMLALLEAKLRDRGLEAQVRCSDVRLLALGKKFDLILLPSQSFSELVGAADQRRALEAIAEHLAPGGRFLCTLHNPAIRGPIANGQLRVHGRWSNGDRTTILLTHERYDPGRKIIEATEFFEEYGADGRLESKRIFPISYHLLSRADFELLASFTGFRVAALYGDYDRSPFRQDESPYMIFTLRRA